MKAKTTYRSSAMVSDENGKMVKFDLNKAKAYVNPEPNKTREILVNGTWCALFVVETSKSTAGIGIQLRSVTLEAGETRLVSATTPKTTVKKTAADPSAMFGSTDTNEDNDTNDTEDDGPSECRI